MRALSLALVFASGCSLVRNADDIIVGHPGDAADTSDADSGVIDRRWALWKMPSITPTGYVTTTVVHDAVTGLDWEAAASTRTNYDGAVAACSALGVGWRLPFRVELVSILALGESVTPAIQTSAFSPPADAGVSWMHWTASTLPSGGRYVVDFTEGTVEKALGSELFYHRCVRSP